MSRSRTQARRPGLRFFCGLFFSGGGFGGRFGVGERMEVLAHLLGSGDVNRTGVRLFFGDAHRRQEFEDELRLDLEFPGQVVDTNLVWMFRHTSGS